MEKKVTCNKHDFENFTQGSKVLNLLSSNVKHTWHKFGRRHELRHKMHDFPINLRYETYTLYSLVYYDTC